MTALLIIPTYFVVLFWIASLTGFWLLLRGGEEE
jgi:hypothetical protein